MDASRSTLSPDDRDELARIIAPLAAICAAQGLRHRWRVRWIGGEWVADVCAGHADDHWRVTGACPWYRCAAASATVALSRAAGYAITIGAIGGDKGWPRPGHRFGLRRSA